MALGGRDIVINGFISDLLICVDKGKTCRSSAGEEYRNIGTLL